MEVVLFHSIPVILPKCPRPISSLRKTGTARRRADDGIQYQHELLIQFFQSASPSATSAIPWQTCRHSLGWVVQWKLRLRWPRARCTDDTRSWPNPIFQHAKWLSNERTYQWIPFLFRCLNNGYPDNETTQSGQPERRDTGSKSDRRAYQPIVGVV